jgi:hypothetical protein
MRRLYGQGQDLGTPDVGFAKSSRTLPPLKRARVASGDRPEPTEAAAETTKLFARLWVLLGESVCHVSSGLSQGPWGKPVPTCSHQFPGPPRRTLLCQPKSVPTFSAGRRVGAVGTSGPAGQGKQSQRWPRPASLRGVQSILFSHSQKNWILVGRCVYKAAKQQGPLFQGLYF